MEYKDIVGDFAERTRINLRYIEEARKQGNGKEVYEVTQLINSMLGLLVFPQQEYCDRIPETTLEQLAGEGWPDIECIAGLPPRPNLKELFKYLRNAIAHFNLRFLITKGEISGVRLWNENSRGIQNWETELSLEELREITERFIAKLKEGAGLTGQESTKAASDSDVITLDLKSDLMEKVDPDTESDETEETDP